MIITWTGAAKNLTLLQKSLGVLTALSQNGFFASQIFVCEMLWLREGTWM